jgi:aminopeptidase Y
VLTYSQLIAHSVATYALSFEGFPKRTDDVEINAETLNAKYRGHKLIM